MEKLNMQTPNLVDENIEKIGRLFPDCLTERTGADGKTEQAIDFDKLKQELSKSIVDGDEERYQFTWPGKKQAIITANAPINKTLRPCREESVDFDNTQNLYIEGDNLDVLKLLREDYLGKVKMIYIDPPYNTGNDFVYEDDFAQSTDDYIGNSGQNDEDGNRLVANTESNGRFHTDWLNMIYPRLKVAKDFLSDDGVIFISIDEKEVENIRKIGDEIFGESNFVSNFIWQSRTSISNDFEVSLNHNHTLIYSKNREKLLFGGDAIDTSDYINPDNDPRGPWKLVPLDANHAGGDTVYPVTNPKTGVDYYPPLGRIWCYNREGMQRLLDDNRIKFGLNDDSSPKRKLFLNERIEKGDKKTPSSLLIDAGTTKDGTTEIMSLFDGQKVFDYPKPVSFIKRLLRYGAPKGGIILDFFSGSGTTAHAVMEYAYEEHISERIHYILIQLPENLDVSYKEATSSNKKTIKNAIQVLDKLNYPHKWTAIAMERIRRAGKKLKEENHFIKQDLDTGFRCLTLDSSNMKDVYYKPSDVTNDLFARTEDNIKEDRTDEDLLVQVMLEMAVPLSAKICSEKICGKKIMIVDDDYLIACFDKDITDEVVTDIAKRKPQYFVMRDSSASDDSVITNFETIFQTYSKDTVRKIL